MMMFGALVLPIASCSEDVQQEVPKPTPTLTVPDGYVNYFEKEEVRIDYPATEIKLTFQVNTDWFVFSDNYEWCTITPKSGNAGLHEITISFTDNYESRQRSMYFNIFESCEKASAQGLDSSK